MAAFDDVVNNPAFGRMMRSSTRYRTLFQQYRHSLFSDKTVSGFMSKIGIHVDTNDQVSYTYEPLGQQVKFNTFEEAKQAALEDRGLKSTRVYGGASNYMSGGATNPFAEDFAAAFPGHTVRARSYQPNNRDDYDWMMNEINGPNGEIYGLRSFGGDGSFNILDVINDKTGARKIQRDILTETKSTMTAQGSAFKRMSLATNDRILYMRNSAAEPLKVLTFDPQRAISSSNPVMKATTENLAAHITGARSGPVYELELTRLYNSMLDGMSYQTRGSAVRELQRSLDRGKQLMAEAEALKPTDVTSEAYDTYLHKKNNAANIIRHAEEQIKNQHIRNVRVSNGVDVITADVIAHAKGNQSTIALQLAQRIATAAGYDVTGLDFNEIVSIMPKSDVKDELLLGLSSTKTMEVHAAPQGVMSDILTMSNFQDTIASVQELTTQANTELKNSYDLLRKGEISGELRQVLDEMRDYYPSQSAGLAAAEEAWRSRKFVRDLDRMTAAGQKVNTNDVLVRQLQSAIQKHYTKFRKGKQDETLMFKGQNVPYSDLSFPVPNSTRAEVIVDAFGVNGTLPRQNTIGIMGDSFNFHGSTWNKVQKLFGGADLDDNLAATLKYDPKAKRLLAMTYRNPNQMGEYMIFDADITMDRAAPMEIRQMWHRQQSLISKFKTSVNAKASDLREIDEIRDTLHRYYSGEQVTLNGKTLDRRAISQLDTMALFDPRPGTRLPQMMAPKGFSRISREESTFTKGSFFHSFHTSQEVVGGGNNLTRRVRKHIAMEEGMETAPNPYGSLFNYVNPDKDEYHELSYFKRSNEIDSLIEASKDIAVDPKTKMPRGITDADILRRTEMEFESRGLLGREVNLDAVINNIINTTSMHGSDFEWNRLHNALSADPLTYIETETVIDTIKKTGDNALVAAISNTVMSDVGRFGNILGTAGIKIDPLIPQRFLANADALKAFREGYASGANLTDDVLDAHMFLDADDPKAFFSRMMQAKIDLAEGMKDVDLGKEAAENLHEKIESMMEFTGEERVRAQEMLERYGEAEQLQRDILATGDPEQLRRLLNETIEGGLDVDSPNDAMMRYLHGLNLETPEALDRQILAAAHLASENTMEGTGSIAPLMESSFDDQVSSMANLYTAAVQRRLDGPAALSKLRDVSDMTGLREFITDEGELTDLSRQIYDPAERSIAILNQMIHIRKGKRYGARTSTMLNNHAETLISHLEESGQVIGGMDWDDDFPEQIRYAFGSGKELIPEGFRMHAPAYRERMIEGVRGGNRLAARSAADRTADDVINVRSVRNTMLKLDSEFLKEAWKHPGFRKGVIGAGIFAGIGIVNRMTKDPTPEDAAGPPLLPGGGPYEGYDMPSMDMVGSMYSQIPQTPQGMLYQVRASGDFDPSQLSGSINQISGNSPLRTNIGQMRQVLSNPGNSMMQLRDRMGV